MGSMRRCLREHLTNNSGGGSSLAPKFEDQQPASYSGMLSMPGQMLQLATAPLCLLTAAHDRQIQGWSFT